MKILALRVCNLASLAGESSVDFEAAPLAHAGLFAITGPTGAGKSTLLDALSLALYDRLPRLAHASRTEIGGNGSGDERIPGNDVRTILRHGAGHGFAEVVFAGRDNGRYRARWEVKRARGRANGRLQAQTLSLTDITTGASLGGGKTETLDAIRDKVGLDYGQFRRSVLLAQNEFDAFLRAKPAERAELLELMTGTAIYGQLSVAAHERCRDERAILDALDAELQRVSVLPDDERVAVEAQHAAAGDEWTRLTTEVDALVQENNWHRVSADLAARIGEAELQVTAAGEADRLAAPERARLAKVRLALSAAPVVSEAARLSADLARLTGEEEAAQKGLSDSKTELDLRLIARNEAKAADEAAEAAFKAAGLQLDRASALDTQIADGNTRLEHCRNAVTGAEALSAQAQTMLGLSVGEYAASTDKVAKIEDWLARHQDRKALADQIDRWAEAIAAHAKARHDRDEAAGVITLCAARRKNLEAETAASRTRRTEIEAALTELDAAIARLGADLPRKSPDELDQLRGQLEKLAAEAVTAQGLLDRQQDLAARKISAQLRHDTARTDITAIDDRCAGIDAILSEARRALDLAIAAEGEEAALMRERLIDGEPCPVCGSPDHPVDKVATGLTAFLVAHRQRVTELETERANLTQRRSDAAAMLVSAQEMIDQIEAEIAGIDTGKADLTRRWAEIAAVIKPAIPTDPFGDLSAFRIECRRRSELVAADINHIRAIQADINSRSEERDNLRTERQNLTDRAGDALSGLAEAMAKHDRAIADRDRADGEIARLGDLLAPPLSALADWRQRDAALLVKQCRHLAEEWRQYSASLETEKEAARRLASKVDSAKAAAGNAALNAKTAAIVMADEEKSVIRLRDARALLFENRPTNEIRTSFNTACKARNTEHRQAQDQWAAADRAYGIAQEKTRVLAKALAAAISALDEATKARDARLTEIGLDMAGMREALALGKTWATAEEARQAALRDKQTIAAAILAERNAALATHRSSGRPARQPAELAVLIPERSSARDAARDVASALQTRLTEDDRNRGAAHDTRRRIAGQRQIHDLWKGMSDLIGSADGKKFRLFAQGLTLDRLLQLANTHLADLTPRYELQRAPGGDLDLQVADGDMADEVRGVASLSGGERFLVSLSLALGLASMTGSRILSESLFIDEGFGALDAESLDVAISALETLHASGRKVGVISHVQPMIERIGVQIRVTKQGGGRSAIEISAAT